MSEQFEKMTVLELRKAAKEMGVKLGAGISKQGIIEKLTEAAGTSAPAPVSVEPDPAPAEAPARVIRSASIITDEETEDDIPVLTPHGGAISPRPMQNRPATASGASSLSNISSKAPAFTMEGSRAWHNPRSYQSNNNSYQRAPQAWGAPRPAQQLAPNDSRGFNRPAAPQPQRPDPRMMSPAPRPAAYPPPRFGPDQSQPQEERPMDYRQPAYSQPQPEYTPAPRNDYSTMRNDYAQPRENPAFNQQPAYSRPAQPAYFHKETPAGQPASAPEMLAGGECGDGEGVLEVHADGYGFLRTNHYLSGKNDVYVANAQIRRFNLRTGDYIIGKTRPQRENDRYNALLYITEINGKAPEESPERACFEELTPIYPKRPLALSAKGEKDLSLRLTDMLCPIGFGQRALISLPQKANRASLIKKFAHVISSHHPKAYVMVMLVDEKPEEVTAMKDAVKGEVVYSTFDEQPENQAKVCELALERAQRLVEQKKDVVILLDNLNALVHAHHILAPQSVRMLENGLAATATVKPKRIFGAARNTKEAGTLTILAMIQTGTGSKTDEALLQEFRQTCNMELVLEKGGILPVNFQKSYTRHDELMLSESSMEAAKKIRAMLETEEGAAQLISMLEKTENNAEFLEALEKTEE